jgi:SNF2 family DNA or RNA helicase
MRCPATDRGMQVIDKYELWKPKAAGAGRGKKPKFDVILTSFEILRDCGRLFESIGWSALVVDEAHRLKSLKSAVR